MSINLTVVVDNDEAIRKFRELQKVAKTSTSNIVSDTDRMDMAMRRLGTAIGSLGLGISFSQLARNVATVRGEFQQLEVAFTTMLGSKAEADMLMERTVEFAAKTPFDLQGVASGTKQLLAFGSEASEVTDEMRMLGDIAAGLSMPIGDLVYLYGTTRTQGRMFTMDLRQFMGRGIPLAKELANQFGVAESRVSELVTEGKVGFEDMRKALVSMTSEGGKFYNLMEEQSKTITGQMSNLEDSIQQMFNAIGKESEGVITSAIEGASYLVENYAKVGRVLMDIVAAYGSYKAAVMLVSTLQTVTSGLTAAETAHYLVLLAKEKVMKSLAITKYLTNPYALAGVAVAGLTFGIYKLITAKSAEEKAQERVDKVMEKSNEKYDALNEKALENTRILKDANASTDQRKEALDRLNEAYPDILEKYDAEKLKLEDILAIEKEIEGIHIDRQITDLRSVQDALRNKIKEAKSVTPRYNQFGAQVGAINFSEINTWQQEVEQLSGNIEELENKKKQLSEEKPTKKPKTELTAEELKQIANERQKAQEDANKAELDLYKEHISDKALILQAEMMAELKAIDERIKATSDAETLGYLRQLRKNTEEMYDTKIGKVLEEDIKAFQQAEDERNVKEQETLKELLEKYDSYTKSREAIEKSFDDDIAALQAKRTAENSEAVDKAIEEAKRQKDETLADYDLDKIGGSDLFIDLFSNVNEMTNRQLKEILNNARNLIKYINGTTTVKPLGFTDEQLELLKEQPDQIKTIYDALLEKQEEFDRRNEFPFSNIIKGLKKLREAHELATKAASATTKEEKEISEKGSTIAKGEAMKYLKQGALNAAAGVSFLAEKMGELAEVSDSESIRDMAESLEAAASFISDVAQGAVSGGWIGALVSAGQNIISQISNAFVQSEKSYQEFLASERDFLNEYKLSLLQLKGEDYETIFGVDSLQKAIGAYKKAQEALAEYNKEMSSKASDYYYDVYQRQLLRTKDPYDAEIELKKMRDYYDEFFGEMTKLEGMMVKTRDRSKFAELFGAKDEYTMLKDLRPELWDEDGNFNIEEAEIFLKTNKQLSEEQRAQIQHVIDLKKQYEELNDVINQTIQSMLDGISTDITSIIFDSVRNGTDAWDAFEERGAEVIDSLGKMMIQELFVKAYLDQFLQPLTEAFSLGEPEKTSYKMAEIINNMFDGMGAMLEGASMAAAAWDKNASDYGFSMDSLTGAAKEVASTGFQAMSQETGSELNGRFTDIQGKVTEIRSFVMDIMATGKMHYAEMINVRDIMLQINGNVADISLYTKVLPEMRDAMNTMNRKLDNL